MMASDLIDVLRGEMALMGDREVVICVLDEDDSGYPEERGIRRVGYRGVSITLDVER